MTQPQRSADIVVYGTRWCGLSNRTRRLLDQHEIPYTFVDIDENREAGQYVQEVNRGFRSVPTIVFPDGSVLVEPQTWELERKIGLDAGSARALGGTRSDDY